jgi:hypothetical protein
VTAALAELVGTALEARRPELVELVRQEVDRRLEALVVELVAGELEARRNGAGYSGLSRAEPELEAPATRLCSLCGEQKPSSDYQPGRARCRSCRAREPRAASSSSSAARRRAGQTCPRLPPPGAAERARPSGGRRNLQTAERSRRLIAAAQVELVERDRRTFTLRRLAGGDRVELEQPAPVRSRGMPRGPDRVAASELVGEKVRARAN